MIRKPAGEIAVYALTKKCTRLILNLFQFRCDFVDVPDQRLEPFLSPLAVLYTSKYERILIG